MQIEIIDIEPLVRIRQSFRLRWRLGIAAVFLFFAYSWGLLFFGVRSDN